MNQNQSSEKDFLSSDLLVTDTEGQRYSPVNLDFRHAMSRVTVNIRNMEETLSDEERKQMQEPFW